jgi:hypothetical protein
MLQVGTAQFTVSTTAAEVVIGVNRRVSDAVLPNFALVCDGGTTVHLEVSFYQVRNPGAVTVIVRNGTGNRVTLESGLVNVPEVTVKAQDGGAVEVTLIAKLPIFTAELALWAFVALLGIIAVISLILCVVGNYCLTPEEQFDVSTENESDERAKRMSEVTE